MKIIIVIIVIVSGAAFFQKDEIHSWFLRKKYFQSVAPVPPSVLLQIGDDLSKIEGVEIFTSIGGDKDAGSFFEAENPHLRLPSRLKEILGTSVWTKVNDPMSDFDFSWMTKLRSYNHWVLKTDSQKQTPYMKILIQWSLARLIHGRVIKDVRASVEDVTHLARLLWSTQTESGANASISILKLLHILKLSDPEEYGSFRVVDAAKTLNAARRFVSIIPFLTDPRQKPQLRSEYLGQEGVLCMSVGISLESYLQSGEALKRVTPEAYQWMNDLVLQTDELCKESLSRSRWKESKFASISAGSGESYRIPNFGIPFLRRKISPAEVSPGTVSADLMFMAAAMNSKKDYLAPYLTEAKIRK